MHIYQPADPQPCYYCKKIEDFEDGYPIREGVFTAEHIVFRCPWHAKFQCSRCGKLLSSEINDKRKKIIELKVEKKGNGVFSFTRIKRTNSICNECFNKQEN